MRAASQFSTKPCRQHRFWLDDLMHVIRPDRHVAWQMLGAVLRTLRDRLYLSAQLPLLVRGLYYDQWHPRPKPLKLRSAKQFLEEVSEGLTNIRPVRAELAAQAVFQLLNHYLDPGQSENVRGALSFASSGRNAQVLDAGDSKSKLKMEIA